jgi:hypothetical protein
MPKQCVQPEELIGKLRNVDGLRGRGREVVEVVKALTVVASGHVITAPIERSVVFQPSPLPPSASTQPHHSSNDCPHSLRPRK